MKRKPTKYMKHANWLAARKRLFSLSLVLSDFVVVGERTGKRANDAHVHASPV